MKLKYLRVTILAILLYIFASPGAMADYEGCEYKRQQLDHQLEYALAYKTLIGWPVYSAHYVGLMNTVLTNGYWREKKIKLQKNKERSQSVGGNWHRSGHQENGNKSRISRQNWINPVMSW